MGALRALAGAGQHPTDFQKTFMDSRCIRMPITHNTPKACVGIVEQCLGLNQVAEGGGARGIGKRVRIKPAKSEIHIVFAPE